MSFAAFALVALSGCRAQQNPQKIAIPEPYTPNEYSVGFDISSLPGSIGSSQWLAVRTTNGKTARFRIELRPSAPAKGQNASEPNFSFGDGSFFSEPDSDAAPLIADLKKVLEAKHLPGKAQRAKSLSFTYAILGSNQSRDSGGGFNDQPAGDWIAIKVFLGDNDEGEFFLNLNPVLHKGEFSGSFP